MSIISGFHHLTSCVDDADEDVGFHVGLLGRSLLKKTVLLRGEEPPLYHFHYGNSLDNAGTLVTSFPSNCQGRQERSGSGQIKAINYSVPLNSLDFWRERFESRGVLFDAEVPERFGELRQRFQHPCGIEFDLVASECDPRAPCPAHDVPLEFAIRGVHSITISLHEVDDAIIFMTDALDFRHVGECGLYHRFKTGDGAPGTIVDILFEPEVRHGSSDRGEGTIHHVAFAVDSVEQQAAIKERLMAMGHVDTSDSSTHCVDLGSTCFKMPGGVMFKALASP